MFDFLRSKPYLNDEQFQKATPEQIERIWEMERTLNRKLFTSNQREILLKDRGEVKQRVLQTLSPEVVGESAEQDGITGVDLTDFSTNEVEAELTARKDEIIKMPLNLMTVTQLRERVMYLQEELRKMSNKLEIIDSAYFKVLLATTGVMLAYVMSVSGIRVYNDIQLSTDFVKRELKDNKTMRQMMKLNRAQHAINLCNRGLSELAARENALLNLANHSKPSQETCGYMSQTEAMMAEVKTTCEMALNLELPDEMDAAQQYDIQSRRDGVKAVLPGHENTILIVADKLKACRVKVSKKK
jgi:hypothetical protein